MNYNLVIRKKEKSLRNPWPNWRLGDKKIPVWANYYILFNGDSPDGITEGCDIFTKNHEYYPETDTHFGTILLESDDDLLLAKLKWA